MPGQQIFMLIQLFFQILPSNIQKEKLFQVYYSIIILFGLILDYFSYTPDFIRLYENTILQLVLHGTDNTVLKKTFYNMSLVLKAIYCMRTL